MVVLKPLKIFFNLEQKLNSLAFQHLRKFTTLKKAFYGQKGFHW